MSAWPTVALGDIFEIARGGSPRPIDDFITDDPAGINWIMISDATEGSKYIASTKKRIRPNGAQRSRQVKPGDFLLTNSMSFGKPYIMRTQGCIHDGWLVLSPRSSNVDADFFYYLLGSNAVYAEFERRASGATVKNLNIDLVRGVKVPLPPLPEQRWIAGILDKADALRAKRRAALAQLDSLTQSIFIDMFGDPATNPKGWPVRRLAELCRLVNGRAFKPEEWEVSGLPIIRIQNLNDSTKPFNYTRRNLPERFHIRTGDILFSWSGTPGTSFGCFRWTGPEGWLNQHIFNVHLDHAIDGAYFITHLNLKLDELISKAHGGVGLQHVTKRMIDETRLMVPPSDAQRAFARRESSVQLLREREANAQRELQHLFESMQHRAFCAESVSSMSRSSVNHKGGRYE